MDKAVKFIKNEIVLIISFVLALISIFFIPIGIEYVDYIDFKTLAVLFCLMAITNALSNEGFFSLLAEKMLNKVKSVRQIAIAFTFLCFFSSMLITNDVALITFVPFTILTLSVSGNTKPLIPIVVMETIASNLGSMLTPIGNPQNLYLFSKFRLSVSDFFPIVLPYAALSLLLITVFCFLIKNSEINAPKSNLKGICLNKYKCIVYCILFIIALLTVFKLINTLILLISTVLILLFLNKKAIAQVDYSLLFTFVFLFIFIGNLGKIDAISSFLSSVINGKEVSVAIVTSQLFSNVPCTILLSSFSNNVKELLIGVNLGGLGTLIASMASLISFKLICKANVNKMRYVLVFTLFNIIFLIINLVLYFALM